MFLKDRAELLERNKAFETEIFSEELIKELPEPI